MNLLKTIFCIAIIILLVGNVVSGQITTSRVKVEETGNITSIEGNVGIGISTPSDGLLHVYKNATTGGWGSINTSYAGLRIQDKFHNLYIDGNSLYSSGGMNIGTFANSSITLGTNDKSRLSINGDGNIGIGTTAPTNSLVHIYRDATTGGISSVNTANAGLRIQDSGASLYIDGNTLYSTANMVLGTLSSNTTFSVGTNNAERFRVDANGNVGIGITNPSERLHVNGKIRATGQVGWSDFVFEENYDLPSLEEVSEHIKKKGHLQDIPSEEEVVKEGYNLGDMDAKLLQKIEELTLYLIEQNKRLDAQEKEIKGLKAQIKN